MFTAEPRVHARTWRRAAWPALPVALGLLTLSALGLDVKPATVGFLYLIVVLGFAAWGGGAVGAVAAVAAALAFNYFFLPPFGRLAVDEPEDWAALGCFLAAAAFASRLVASAREQAAEAQRRRREVESLYDLCFGLFATSQRPGALGEAFARTLRAIGAEAGRLALAGENRRADPAGADSPDDMDGMELADEVGGPLAIDEGALLRAWRESRLIEEPESPGDGQRTAYVPLDVGERATGVLVARGRLAPRTVLAPAGRLLALALERERLLGEAAHLEAVRASEALKTSLLRAVSHDLRTPLTSIRLEIESLTRRLAGAPEAALSLRTLGLEQERLARRIDNLLSLARLDAGVARPHPEAVPPSSLFRAAGEGLAGALDGRRVEVHVAARCPDLWADPSLSLESLVNLLENAARAAPAGTPIELVAEPAPGAPGRVFLEVRDRGPGVPAGVRRPLGAAAGELWRDAGPGDSIAGGLGLQIAASFAAASGGSLALYERPGGGTVARLDLPAAAEPPESEPESEEEA